MKKPKPTKKKPFVHPELKRGEMWLTNISSEYVHTKSESGFIMFDSNKRKAAQQNFDDCGFKTKRLGVTAYNSKGDVIESNRPIFVQKSEYLQNQKELKKKKKPFTHPELKKGEVWYTDISTQFTSFAVGGGLFSLASRFQVSTGNALHYNFSSIGYESKRLGLRSYDELGRIKDNFAPVFVKKTEFAKVQKELNALFDKLLVLTKKKKKKLEVREPQKFLNKNGN